MTVALAILSAICFASSHVTAKRGLEGTSIFAGLLIQLAVAFAVVFVALLLQPPVEVGLAVVLIFAVAGLIAPGTARAFALAGVDRLGPSVAVPIQQGTRPVLTVLGAIVFLGEPVSPLQLVGVLAIALGGWRLSRARAPDLELVADSPPSATAVKVRRGFKPGIVFPLVTAVCYTTSDLVVKAALNSNSDPNPTLGTVLGIGAALVVWTLATAAIPRLRASLRFGRSARWFAASGMFMGFAILSMFHALDRGEVSVVSPIISAQTLVVFLLSTVLLRHLEHITRDTVLAGGAVLLGTILVSS